MKSLKSLFENAPRFLAEKIQRDKSRDSSARGITYILEEQSSKEENEGMYNGGGLGLKGSGAC